MNRISATKHVSRIALLAHIAREYLKLGIINNPSNVNANMTFTGAIPDIGSLIAALNQLSNNGAFAGTGMVGPNSNTAAGAALTLSSLGGLNQSLTNGGAVTITIDSAYNIVNNLNSQASFAYPGQTFSFQIQTIAGTTVATPTLLSTDVTLTGTTSVLAAAMRWYKGTITQYVTITGAPMTAGTTFTSLTQIGTSNLFTVALATNALVPVVGTALLLTGITGTLPPGWYPIVKVTSATSFVIATPIGTVWTATAATVPGTTTIPVSAYNVTPANGIPGSTSGLYAPLVTINGVMATVTAVMSA
jgi:hypothetical protein